MIIETKYFEIYTYVGELEDDSGEFMTWFRVQFPKKFQELVDLAEKAAWDPELRMGEEPYKAFLQWAIDIRMIGAKYRNDSQRAGLFVLAVGIEKLVHRSQEEPPTVIHAQRGKVNEQREQDTADEGTSNFLTPITGALSGNSPKWGKSLYL